jgi:hypothetical protein
VHTPIAYTYEADYHCPYCAMKRWGACPDGFIGCPDEPHRQVDSEGNDIGVLWTWDEWWDTDGEFPQYLVCGTCLAEIDSVDK